MKPIFSRCRFAVAGGLLGLFSLVPIGSARLVDRLVAVVNQQIILLSEVDRRCQPALDDVPSTLEPKEAAERKKKIRDQTLQILINEMLIRQKVVEHKITVSDDEVQKKLDELIKANQMTQQQFSQALRVEGKTLDGLKTDLRVQMEKEKLMSMQMQLNPELKSKMQVAEKDIEDYYLRHYSRAEKVRASHILFVVQAGADSTQQQKIRARAQEVLDRIRAGASFVDMAKQYSDDPSGSVGGDLGWFGRGDMVAAFENAAYGLKKGQISDLVRSRFGFHIIKVTDRATKDRPPLKKVRNQIYQRLFGQKYQRAIQAWLEELRSMAFIDIKL